LGQFWTSNFGADWASLGERGPVLDDFGLLWATSGNCGSFGPVLDEFGPLWAILDIWHARSSGSAREPRKGPTSGERPLGRFWTSGTREALGVPGNPERAQPLVKHLYRYRNRWHVPKTLNYIYQLAAAHLQDHTTDQATDHAVDHTTNHTSDYTTGHTLHHIDPK
jgi:hypothetical protein